MVSLFVYGTLINDEVVKAVTGKTFSKTPASLAGYFVARLDNLKCPGLVIKPGSIANGYILEKVDQQSLRLIDEWEDSGYKLTQIITDGGVKCNTYLWTKGFKNEAWNNSYFRNKQLNGYIKNIA